MAKVLNIKDCNYKVPNGAIYVGRAMPSYKLPASKWGNPYKMGKGGTREEVIAKYHTWLCNQIAHSRLSLHELKNKDLVCWCSPLPCHGDVLLELANKPE